MALLEDINTKLEADSVTGGATGWTVRIGPMTDQIDQLVVLAETGGFPPDQFGSTLSGEQTFQVRVRAGRRRYDTARSKMQDVFNSLNASTISGHFYTYALSSGPLFMGFDANERPEFVQNFKVRKAL